MDEIYEYNGKQYTLAQLQSKYGDKTQYAISKLGFKRIESAPKEETYTYKDKTFTRKDLEAKYGDKTDEAINKFGFESSVKKKDIPDSTSPDPNLASEEKTVNGSQDSTQDNKNTYSYSNRLEELKNSKVAPLPITPEQKKEEVSVFRDLTNRFKSGGLNALSGLAGLPNYINKLTSSLFLDKESLDDLNKLPANVREIVLAASNPQQFGALQGSIEAQNFLTDKAEKLSEKTIQYEGNIIDDVRKGDFGKATYRTIQGATESLPSMAMAIIPGGLVAIGSGTASQKQEEQDRSGKDLGIKTVVNSLINGVAEGYFEKYTAGMLKPLKQMAFGNKEIAKEISENIIKTVLKDIGLEGGSEALTSITQDLSDKLVAGEDISIAQIIKNSIDSGIIGGAMGGGTGSLAGIQSYVSTKTRSAETNKKLNDNAKISEELNKEIGNQPSKEVLDALKSKKDDIDNESAEIHKEEISKVEKLTNDEIKEVFEIDKEIKEASKTYKELDSQEMNPDIKNIIKKDIEEKTTKLEERKNEIVNPKDAKSEETATQTKEQPLEEASPKTTEEQKSFAEQLGETEDIGDIVQGATKTKVGDSDIVLKENGDIIKLESISTPTDKRGLGSAKNALEQLTTLADAQGKTLELNVVPLDETTNPEILVQLYESLGFTKEENFDIDGGKMTRLPNESNNNQISKPNENVGSQEVVTEIPNSNQIKTLLELESENKTTLPKIPSEKIFKNEVSPLNKNQTKGVDKIISDGKENDLPSEKIDVELIVPTQKTVNTNNLKKTSEITEKTKINEPIILVKENGKFFVVDGHHRISNDILNGKTTIEAKVFDNETTPKPNTKSNADVQSNIEPSIEQGQDNDVQATVEPTRSKKEIEIERDTEIAKLEKPTIKLSLASSMDLVNSKDPIGNKQKHNDIKDRYKKLKALTDCL